MIIEKIDKYLCFHVYGKMRYLMPEKDVSSHDALKQYAIRFATGKKLDKFLPYIKSEAFFGGSVDLVSPCPLYDWADYLMPRDWQRSIDYRFIGNIDEFKSKLWGMDLQEFNEDKAIRFRDKYFAKPDNKPNKTNISGDDILHAELTKENENETTK